MMFKETRHSDDLIQIWQAQSKEANRPDPGSADQEQKIFLPRGSAETRFAPRQYYYLASRTGVMPSWAVTAQPVASPY